MLETIDGSPVNWWVIIKMDGSTVRRALGFLPIPARTGDRSLQRLSCLNNCMHDRRARWRMQYSWPNVRSSAFAFLCHNVRTHASSISLTLFVLASSSSCLIISHLVVACMHAFILINFVAADRPMHASTVISQCIYLILHIQ